ncbi:pyrroline-5-carboxylate reductase [Profundibacterium mesophilum]|uniref:Pyrroline-5-carboxylate reductase n=1 Tax=Profundibacterium mesophilum KAUST100406-0324 TaxID=1037889 RepID=A0A921NRX9_9RHOB|nr:pyrroline-5-carboxylate reductase [Profundibacterium mesophilum]KAF0676622.1 Pyrroline-5-carboxylate reductase [Profundibacterium mesophilum KAUST100406-0324]
MDDLRTRGLVLVGCGKMGSAMLDGWLRSGFPASSVWVIDPKPGDWLAASGVHLNEGLPERPAMVVVAVKPQVMDTALPGISELGRGDTTFLSVAAGVTIATFEDRLGAGTPVIRAMPNTPAAIGRGITAIACNAAAQSALPDAEALLGAVGQTVRLDGEAQIDAVTALSGSGPAYVFALIEAMAAAGEAEGLPADMAMRLAKATVGGAGQLAEESTEPPGILRRNVTSPNGTTQAGLEVLLSDRDGLGGLIGRTVAAAAARSRELRE